MTVANQVVAERPLSESDRRWGRATTVIGFALVGASGVIVNQLLLWSLVSFIGVQYLVAAILATQGSTTWNFTLNELLVFHGRGARGTSWRGVLTRFIAFAAVNNATLLARVPLLAFFTSVLHINYLISNLMTLVLLFVARFAVSDRLIWRPAPVPESDGGSDNEGDNDKRVAHLQEAGAAQPAEAPAGARRSFAYLYDIHGFASVASDVELRELKYFRVQTLFGGADVEVRVGRVGGGPRRRIDVIESPGVVLYREQLGRLGANFHIQMFDRVKVTVAPLLAASPHVVYTNIIEALLRFVLASRDLALLHSATLILEDQGVMLSAHTDTGKTATILRMLREQGGVFLSDDMTIVSGDGRVFAYPKPLTISHHTLGAIDGSLQTWSERTTLRLKSTLHSKSGRGAGMSLARHNLPIMSMNAITQAVIPPPKYEVDSLVPCEIGASTRVQHLFLIGRGPRLDAPVGPAAALRALVENTDDAYGFPPFQVLAPIIEMSGENYPALRRRERSIIRQMLTGVAVRRMIRDDFSWADDIPRLLRDQAAPEAAPAAMIELAPQQRMAA